MAEIPGLRRLARSAAVAALLWLAGCATYTTPGAGVSIPNLSQADADIAELLKAEPAAPFPARMAVVRVQAPGYNSSSNSCYGKGRYCVVTTRDVESAASFERIAALPRLAGLAPMSRLLLPTAFGSLKDLRVAAAGLKTDLLLLYSLDTGFTIDSVELGPLSLVTLGFLPNKTARVTATASAAIFDARTGFIFGVAETTAVEERLASSWTSGEAIDSARIEAEQAAFDELVGEVERLWGGIVATHAAAGSRGS